MSGAVKEHVAIVGISSIIPSDIVGKEGLWHVLSNKKCVIGTVPTSRWNTGHYTGPADKPGKVVTDRGGFLHDVDMFDASAFGISGREAEEMSQEQRWLLKVAHQALDDSACVYRGTDMGVFVAASQNSMQLEKDAMTVDEYQTTGSSTSICANRISFVFDLHGPSFAVDSACSSSMTAVHVALQALHGGDCSQALVAGMNIASNNMHKWRQNGDPLKLYRRQSYPGACHVRLLHKTGCPVT